jgi:hypothetical protein
VTDQRGDSGGDSSAGARRKGTREKWEGGFVRKTKRGVVYVIERHINGEYFKASTRCSTRPAAVKELARFELDPHGYVPAGGEDRLCLTTELVLEHREYQVEEKGNSREWALECARFLADWMEDFGGKDLRRVSITADVKPALRRRKTSQPHRVEALKGFYTWLRKEKGLVKHYEDPMPDMRIPRARPRRETAPRDRSLHDVEAVLPFLRPDLRDVLQLLAGTGWHVQEVRRFAESGEIRRDPTGKHLAVLVTWHKRREKSASYIDHVEHLEAAERIRARGKVPSRNVTAAQMRKACAAAGVKLNLGDLRHTVGTWAYELGAPMDQVAKSFNHTDEKMARQHYVRHAVPHGSIPTRALTLVKA